MFYDEVLIKNTINKKDKPGINDKLAFIHRVMYLKYFFINCNFQFADNLVSQKISINLEVRLISQISGLKRYMKFV